jgi:hypothetical protein
MPEGIITTPPPLLLQAVIASLIDFVFNVMPSAFAPNFIMLSVSFLNFVAATAGSFISCAKTKQGMKTWIYKSSFFIGNYDSFDAVFVLQV